MAEYNAARKALDPDVAAAISGKKSPKKAADGTPKRPGPQPKAKESVRDEALAIMDTYGWDVQDATLGLAKNGYLNPNHLKQLAIHKGVFASVVKPTRMALIKALTPQAIFAEERKQKAAAAADDDDDDDDDEDEEDGEEEN